MRKTFFAFVGIVVLGVLFSASSVYARGECGSAVYPPDPNQPVPCAFVKIVKVGRFQVSQKLTVDGVPVSDSPYAGPRTYRIDGPGNFLVTLGKDTGVPGTFSLSGECSGKVEVYPEGGIPRTFTCTETYDETDYLAAEAQKKAQADAEATAKLAEKLRPYLVPQTKYYPPVDACPNIPGTQETIIGLYKLDQQANCIPLTEAQPVASTKSPAPVQLDTVQPKPPQPEIHAVPSKAIEYSVQAKIEKPKVSSNTQTGTTSEIVVASSTNKDTVSTTGNTMSAFKNAVSSAFGNISKFLRRLFFPLGAQQ